MVNLRCCSVPMAFVVRPIVLMAFLNWCINSPMVILDCCVISMAFLGICSIYTVFLSVFSVFTAFLSCCSIIMVAVGYFYHGFIAFLR